MRTNMGIRLVRGAPFPSTERRTWYPLNCELWIQSEEAAGRWPLEQRKNELDVSRQERAMALAQLQTKAESPPIQPEPLDLPSLIARWHDSAQLSRNTGERTTQGQQRSRPAGLRKSHILNPQPSTPAREPPRDSNDPDRLESENLK